MKKFDKIVLSETEPSTGSIWLKPDKSLWVYDGGWKQTSCGDKEINKKIEDLLGKVNNIDELIKEDPNGSIDKVKEVINLFKDVDDASTLQELLLESNKNLVILDMEHRFYETMWADNAGELAKLNQATLDYIESLQLPEHSIVMVYVDTDRFGPRIGRIVYGDISHITVIDDLGLSIYYIPPRKEPQCLLFGGRSWTDRCVELFYSSDADTNNNYAEFNFNNLQEGILISGRYKTVPVCINDSGTISYGFYVFNQDNPSHEVYVYTYKGIIKYILEIDNGAGTAVLEEEPTGSFMYKPFIDTERKDSVDLSEISEAGNLSSGYFPGIEYDIMDRDYSIGKFVMYDNGCYVARGAITTYDGTSSQPTTGLHENPDGYCICVASSKTNWEWKIMVDSSDFNSMTR